MRDMDNCVGHRIRSGPARGSDGYLLRSALGQERDKD
jgi:hypothetical protein